MQHSRYQSGFSVVKLLLPILFIGCGIMLFQYLLDSEPDHKAPVPKEKTWSVQVQTLAVERLSPEIEIQGKVEAPDRFRAAAPGAGWVETVNVREGDRVGAGQVLVGLDPRDFTTALTQAEAELADIEAQLVEGDIRFTQDQAALLSEKSILELTRKSLARSSRLKKQSLSSDAELEEAQRALMRQQLLVNQRELAVKSYDSKKQQLEARKQRVQAQMEQAHRALERSLALAPYDGIVSAVNVAAGGRVNAGTEMVTMYSPSGLEVRGLIPARYQNELALALDGGQELVARAANSATEEEALKYLLVRLAGEAKPGGVDGFFQASVPATAGLSPGALITLRLKRPSQDGLYRVPPTAIYDNTRIYLLREGRLAGVLVDIVGAALFEGESIRLISSDEISAGDRLVLTRLPNATTGLKVEAIETQ
ncbi:MAG: biotin/lipoyl-binding protein [Proteobacteria bacterium]|nr:biotin/lipoyl-binding protein [Pseudomonadota bacterium]